MARTIDHGGVFYEFEQTPAEKRTVEYRKKVNDLLIRVNSLEETVALLQDEIKKLKGEQ